MLFFKYVHKGACDSLPLVLKAVIENDMRLCCAVGDVADWSGELSKLIITVVIVEANGSGRGPGRTPGGSVAAVQTYEREFGLGHFPYSGCPVRH